MKKFVSLFILLLLLVACEQGDNTDANTSDEAETAVSPSQEADDNETAVSDTPSAQTDKIIIQMALYDWQSGQYNDLIEAFEADNPDIEIKTVSVEEILGLEANGLGQWPDDAGRRLASASDILSNNVVGFGINQSELLLDLQPLADADPNFDLDDFYPSALAQYQSDDGQLLGLTTQLNFTLLFFQKDAFDAAGIPYPEPGWSWEDFLAAAQATTIREGDEVVQWGLVQPSNDPFDFVLPRAGSLVDDTTEPPTPIIDRPEVVEAMQWYADLYLVHQVAPNLERAEPNEDGSFVPAGYELIENGTAAMWPDWSGSWEWRSQSFDLGVVPFPVDAPADKTTQMFSNGLAISAGTQNPEAAWRWLAFLSGQPGADEFSRDTAVPARISVAEASGFWDNVEPELGTALAYALEHAYTPQFSAGYGAFSVAAEAILQEGKSVEEALAEAQLATEAEIAEAVSGETEADDEEEELVVVAPEVESLPAGAVNIIFSASGGPGSLQPYRDLVDTFRETHPDIVVEITTPNFGSTPTTLADVAADADCLRWSSNGIDAESQAAILNLDPFLDADPALGQDDFYPQVLDMFTAEGQLWGLPSEINISVIMYNKTLFDAAGVAYPAVDWTTDDFLETAVSLTNGDDPATKQYGYLPQEFEINDLITFLERRDAQLVDDSQTPPQLSFTDTATLDAMRWVTSLTTEFGVKPTFITDIGSSSINSGEERKTLIEDGRGAMWSDQGFQSFPETNLDALDIGVAPFPVSVTGQTSISNSVAGYFISSSTEQRQACWQWITFLSEQPLLNNDINVISARPSIAQSDAYAQRVGEELAAANLASIERANASSIEQRFGTDLSWLGIATFWWPSYAYDQILSNGVSVDEAMADIQAKADAYRACIIERDGFDDLVAQRTCLGEVDESVPSFFVEIEEE